MNPYDVTRQFERAIAKYTGARYAVAVTSCTEALLLACAYHFKDEVPEYRTVVLPKRTYVGVPMSVIHAGGGVKWDNRKWVGMYQLKPHPIWDSAKWLTSGMYKKGQFMCISLHWAKTLALGQGGVILHDSPKADKWLRKARFDGRTEGIKPRYDKDLMLGWHCYMSPKEAADALCRLAILPKHNKPQPNDDYPDLSKLDIFR